MCNPAVETCVLISKSQGDMAIIAMSVLGFMSILFLLTLWKTPAFEFLMAFIFGKELAFITNRSNQGIFRTAKPTAEGMLKIPRIGEIMVEPNSGITERVCGRRIYISFGEFASTLPLWWVQAVNWIKREHQDKARPVHNSEDLGDKIGLKFDPLTKQWVQKEIPANQEDKEANKGIVKVTPWYALRFHELSYMFPYNITPALIESKTAHEIAKKQRMNNLINGMTLIYVGVGVLILVIAAYVAYQYFGHSAAQAPVQQMPNMAGNLIKVNMSV